MNLLYVMKGAVEVPSESLKQGKIIMEAVGSDLIRIKGWDGGRR